MPIFRMRSKINCTVWFPFATRTTSTKTTKMVVIFFLYRYTAADDDFFHRGSFGEWTSGVGSCTKRAVRLYTEWIRGTWSLWYLWEIYGLRVESPLHFPTLNWGFTNNTCFVQVEKAALGAYTDSLRQIAVELYTPLTIIIWPIVSSWMMAVDLPVFSLVRRTKNLNEYTYDSVAESIYLFVDAIKIEGSPFYKDFF